MKSKLGQCVLPSVDSFLKRLFCVGTGLAIPPAAFATVYWVGPYVEKPIQNGILGIFNSIPSPKQKPVAESDDSYQPSKPVEEKKPMFSPQTVEHLLAFSAGFIFGPLVITTSGISLYQSFKDYYRTIKMTDQCCIIIRKTIGQSFMTGICGGSFFVGGLFTLGGIRYFWDHFVEKNRKN